MKTLILLMVLLPAICFGAEVDRTLNAPSGDISGLAWGAGKLWCLDDETRMCYGLNPETGAVEESFLATGYASYTPAGLTFNGTYLFASYVNGTASPYVYWYTTSGTYVYYDLIC
jgi:hypothetical protein